MRPQKLLLLTLVFMATGLQAQEMCITCNGTYWKDAASPALPEQLSKDHHFGFCFDRKTKKVTFISEGHERSSWKFDHVENGALGNAYLYWTSKASNEIYGQVTEQIELSDVVLHFQYVARNKSSAPVIAVNGTCVPSTRIGN